ncbi:MAG: hypothetical protein QNJ08_20900, partial [Crocosphaera sp.]|nr:hypothetical protein [Crocosphaera sp.]
GEQTFVEIELSNEGGATANDIQVLLPDAPWLSLATADTIESLAPGESTNVTLALTPGNDLPLTEYQGNLFFDAVGNDGDLAVDFNFRAVSEATGDLAVNVIDEYFYFAEGSPKLSDATVILRDYFTQVEIARMTTDETGMVNFDDLPEGYYSLEVKAEDHDGFSQTVEINAGETETINPFLSFQTVEYNFGVEEIEGGIEDRYNITVNSTFRTDVPVPVVTIDPPLIDLESLTSIGQTLTIELTIENHGLIAAQDIELLFGEHPFYEIKPLIDSFDTLDAKSSLKIPVTITKIGEPEASPFNIASLSTLTETQEVPCVILSSICWGYPCGPENVKKRTLFIFENAECTIPKLPTGNNSLDFLRNFYAALRAASIYYGGSGSGGGGGGGNDDDGNNNSGNGNKPQINSLTPSLPFIELFCDVLKLVPCLKLRRGRGNGPQALLGLLKPLLEGDIPGFLEKTLGMFGLENPGIPVIDPQNPPDIFGLICDRASKKSPLIGTLCDVKDCIEGLLDVLSDRLGLSNISNNSLLANSAIIQLSNTSEIELLIQARDSIQTILDSLTGFFGSDVWLEVNDGEQLENWLINFAQKINTSSNSGSNISEQERQELLNISFPTTLTGTDINRFIDRWNRTLEYWNSGIFTLEDVPDGQSTDFINQSELLSPLQELQVISETSESEGFTDISDYINALVLEAETGLGIDDNSGVCAEVRIAINQEAVMTRSAFLGSLEIDNGSDLNLENISVVLDIRDENGNIVNDFFGITDPILDNITNLDGTGILTSDDPNTSINEGLGSAEWTFIPTNLAAPQEPTVYSIGGILSYTENGQVINVPLLSTPITVNPQAELTLDYFQQRNVFGDDPFTDATEVAEPFSLAVLVKNNGFGDARNLSITSAQPEIIENEKGLFAKFNIIGSQVNGEPASPSLSVDFEDIAAGETAVAEWLLKSSIQGKFNEYEVTFKHINDLGDEELSLIKEVNIHELIQTVQADDDGLSDFLVNDQFDANFYPDTLYFSNGTTASVTAIDDVTIDAPVTIFDLEAEITIFPPSEGGLGGIWTYIILDDPADGQFKIDKIVRNDGTEINPENIWRTDRTFPATGRPTYENKLHFLDFDATATYTIIYDSNENAAPKVREILDVDPNPRDIPVESLTVVFTEAIRVNTFDYQDITLTLDNDNNLITDAVTISRIDPITFRINNLTEITGNIGQYKLSIDATGVQDLAGNIGAGNITETWLFTGDRPTVESVNGFTNNLLTTPVESFTVTFTEIIQANSFTYEDITLTRNEGGNLVNDSIIITQISDRTYQVSNLTQFTNLEGDYELLVIANNIQDLDNNNGLGGKGFTWVLDNTAPILIDIDNLNSPRNTAIASIEVTLDQAIDPETFDYQDITLTLDGSNNLITSDVEIEKRNETTYRIKGLTFLQETEGEYTLTVNGDGIEDNAGNATINDLATTWILDQSQPFSATNIQVTTTPPVNELTPASAAIATINQYGQYRVNSRNITISGELPEENLRVYFKDATTGENLAQASVTGTTFTGDIELSGVGSRTVQLTIQDEAGNSSTGDIDIFADVTEPVLLNFLNIPTTLTVNSVNSIDVQFSEPLDLSTFDRDDLTLLRDGVIVPLPETVTINLVSDNIYRINGLEDVTNTPGNYTIQVDTTTLADNAGNPGSDVQTATFTIEAVSFEPTLDIDDNGVLELQDYNLIDLYASGLDATEFDFLINNFSNDLIGNDANRRDANSILSYFNEVGETLLDIDGNNQIEQQDYNLIDLFASQLDDLEFGFLIDNFTNDLIAENASRNNADLILTYFDTIVPETV